MMSWVVCRFSITGLKIRVFCRAGSTRHKWVIKAFVLLENIPPTMTSRLQADEGENDMAGSPPWNISPGCGRYIKKKEKCQSGFLFRYIKNRPAFHSCRELLFQSGTGVIFFGYLYFRVGIGVFLIFPGAAQRAQCVPGRVVEGMARGLMQNQVGIDPGLLVRLMRVTDIPTCRLKDAFQAAKQREWQDNPAKVGVPEVTS
jgi:hypothetical protein